MRLTCLTGRHRSTIWKVLGAPRRLAPAPPARQQTTRRYEWTEAGALLHIDAFELPKFDRPGHWATGERAEQHKTRERRQDQVVIGVIDDHTRLAYCELHAPRTRSPSRPRCGAPPPGCASRAAARSQAVMTDNAKCYSTSHAFRDTLAELGARHILHPALHAALERQDRALLRHPRHRMGARPRLAQQHPTRPRPVILHPLLQPPPTALSLRRPTTHHPRSPSPRAGQLGRRRARWPGPAGPAAPRRPRPRPRADATRRRRRWAGAPGRRRRTRRPCSSGRCAAAGRSSAVPVLPATWTPGMCGGRARAELDHAEHQPAQLCRRSAGS